MCLLVVKEPGASLSEQAISNAWSRNPDLGGIAYYIPGDGIKIIKPLRNAKQMADAVSAVRKYKAIIHFRLATHGSIGEGNTHPFAITPEKVVAHNGMIKGLPLDWMSHRPSWSDTRYYAHEILRDDGNDLAKHDSHVGYGFFATMYGDGRVDIYNEHLGRRKDGVWYSNSSHEQSLWRSCETWRDYKHRHKKERRRERERQKKCLACGGTKHQSSCVVSDVCMDCDRAAVHRVGFAYADRMLRYCASNRITPDEIPDKLVHLFVR